MVDYNYYQQIIVSINSTPEEDIGPIKLSALIQPQSNQSILLIITVSRTTSLELSIYRSVV